MFNSFIFLLFVFNIFNGLILNYWINKNEENFQCQMFPFIIIIIVKYTLENRIDCLLMKGLCNLVTKYSITKKSVAIYSGKDILEECIENECLKACSKRWFTLRIFLFLIIEWTKDYLSTFVGKCNLWRNALMSSSSAVTKHQTITSE